MNKQREDKTNYTSWNIRECEEFIKEINRKYFDESLSFKVLLRRNIIRHITLSQEIINFDDKMYYRIEINEPELYVQLQDMILDVVTQMILAYGIHNGIKITCNRGVYKNKEFKKVADKVGVITERTKYGYEPRGIDDKLLAIGKKYDFKKMNVYIKTEKVIYDECKRIVAKKPTSTRKYICPSCGDSFRATKEVFFMCKKCKVDAVLANE